MNSGKMRKMSHQDMEKELARMRDVSVGDWVYNMASGEYGKVDRVVEWIPGHTSGAKANTAPAVYRAVVVIPAGTELVRRTYTIAAVRPLTKMAALAKEWEHREQFAEYNAEREAEDG